MTKNALWVKIDGQQVLPAFEDARGKLNGAEGEAVLDFSSVRRVDSAALSALTGFAGAAESQGVKVVLHGVNADVYRVLKLVKLAPRFTFQS